MSLALPLSAIARPQEKKLKESHVGYCYTALGHWKVYIGLRDSILLLPHRDEMDAMSI